MATGWLHRCLPLLSFLKRTQPCTPPCPSPPLPAPAPAPVLSHGSPQGANPPSSSPVSPAHICLFPAHLFPSSSHLSLFPAHLSRPCSPAPSQESHPIPGVLASLPATSTHVNSPRSPSRAWRGSSHRHTHHLVSPPRGSRAAPRSPLLFSWMDSSPDSPVSAPISSPLDEGFPRADSTSSGGPQAHLPPVLPGVLVANGCRTPTPALLCPGGCAADFLMGLGE